METSIHVLLEDFYLLVSSKVTKKSSKITAIRVNSEKRFPLLNSFTTASTLPMWLYSFYLGVYFVLIIRYQWAVRLISRYFEVPAFVVAIGISWSGAIYTWRRHQGLQPTSK